MSFIPNYDELFENTEEKQVKVYLTLYKPETIKTLESLALFDKRSTETIKEAEQLIKILKAYRQDLYKRSQAITTANYTLSLSLTRKRNYYNNKVFYHIFIQKDFDDQTISSQVISKENFPGSERHKALKRFEDLKKAYPGINAYKDIDKAAWEK